MRLKLITLYLCSFIFSTAPLVITFILNKEEYITTPSDTFKLCIGGMMAVILIALKAVGKLKLPSGIVLYGIAFVLSYLLEAILTDLMLLSGMALLGEIIDAAIFKPLIARTNEKMNISKTADATAEQIRAVLDEYMGR